jgi:hypothetical protein
MLEQTPENKKTKFNPSLENQNNKKIPAYTENSRGKLTTTES